MLYVVDTHSLVWFLAGNSGLSLKARTILNDPGEGNRLAVPTILLAESWELARKNRIPISFNPVVQGVRASGALVCPLNLETVNDSQDS